MSPAGGSRGSAFVPPLPPLSLLPVNPPLPASPVSLLLSDPTLETAVEASKSGRTRWSPSFLCLAIWLHLTKAEIPLPAKRRVESVSLVLDARTNGGLNHDNGEPNYNLDSIRTSYHPCYIACKYSTARTCKILDGDWICM